MTSRIKTTRFWIAWIVASLLVYPLTAVFTIAFGMLWFPAIESIFPSSDGFSSATQTISEIYTFLTLVGFGGIIALAIGVLQASVIKRYFHFTPQYWKRATIIGGLIAAPATAFALFALNSYTTTHYWQLVESGQFEILQRLMGLLPMVMYVSVMSVVQVVVLRRYVRNAWLWILANAVAGFMFSMVATMTFNPGFGDWLLAAVAQGAITGFAMLWLLHRLTEEAENAGKDADLAYQHVPIDMDDE